MNVSRFVDAAVDAVLRSGAEVVILTAPGNSRVEVAKRASAKRPGLRVVSYKEGGEGWAVAGERFVEEALGQVERGVGRWLVIPPDTTTANLLYAELRGKKLVEVLYLPEVYERVAKEARAPKEAVEAATVSHWAGGRKKSGVSLKLLQTAAERPGEAQRAVEKIRALAPGRLGLGDVLAEAANAVKMTPLRYMLEFLGEAAAALVLAPVLEGLALAGNLAGVLKAVAEFAEGLVQRTGETAVREPLARTAEWLLQRITGREEARNQFAQLLAGFVKAVIEARQHVDDERYESVVDEVAAQWGLDAATLKNFVDNVYKLAAGKIITEEELRNKLGAIWEEIKKIREEFRGEIAKLQLREAGAFWLEDLERGDVYRDVVAVGGRLKIRVYGGLEEGYVLRDVVTAGAFQKEADNIYSLLGERGFLIVEGPKGIGKSTLAAWLLWRMLSEAKIGVVVKLEEAGAGGGREAEKRRQGLLNLFQVKCGEYGAVCASPLVLYDPSPPVVYAQPKAMDAVRSPVEEDLKFLAELRKKTGVLVLAVLPSDLLTAEAREKFRENIHAPDLKDEEFITALLREYSGCPLSDEAARALAARILRFDEGHALIARLAGEELRRKECRAEEVEKLLDEAQDNALAFIVNYINDLLQVNENRIKAYSKILPVRLLLAPAAMPGGYIMPTSLLERWIEWEGVYAGEPVSSERELRKTASRWLAVKHHDLVETALSHITIYAVYPDEHEVEESLSKKPKPLREALRPWADSGLKMSKEHFSLLAEPQPYAAARLFLENYGGKLAEALQPECWRRLALMTGAALTAHSFKALAEAAEEDVKEGVAFEGLAKALAQCGADYLFLEGGELTPFSRVLLEVSARPGAPHNIYAAVAHKRGELIQELRALWQRWKGRGGFTFDETVYAVGLAVVLARGLGVGGEFGKEDAEIAIRAASFGVQRALHPDAVLRIVEALSPLSKYAPSEWAALLYGASQIEAAKGAVRKELDKLYGSGAEELWTDWVKAYMAAAYARLGDADKACALLDGMKDDALKTITEAIVHYALISRGVGCPGVNVCARLEKVVEELERMGMGPVLQADVELKEYLKRMSPAPEKALRWLLQRARALALSGLAECARDKGEFDKAVEYFSKAAEIDRDLGSWVNYIAERVLALRSLALGALPDKAGELLNRFEELWREALEHRVPTAPYLEKAAAVLGGYLVALALNGRHGDVEELLRKRGLLLRWVPQVDVTVRLTLRLLGSWAEEPSPKEVLEAVDDSLKPYMRPALAEALGLGWREDVTEYCAQFIGDEGELCVDAYSAVRGDRAARGIFEPWARSALAEKGVPLDLLEKADAKRLAEAWAPRASHAQFILLLRALARGDVDTALLHAEVGRAELKGVSLGMLYGELADALRKGDKDAAKVAAAKLYYYHI